VAGRVRHPLDDGDQPAPARIQRPVKWVESRAECLLAAGKEQLHRFRAAYGADGRVLGVHSEMLADHGAVGAGPGWGMAFVGALTLPTGYAVPVCRVDYKLVVTNKPPWWGARPFGKEAPALVMERIMDLVAEATGVDPLMAQIVADRPGVAIDRVTVVQGDTDACPYGFGNLSSRALVAGGAAAALAADDIAGKLRTVAAAMLHTEADRIALANGLAAADGNADTAVPIEAVAHNTYTLGYILALGIEPTLEATRTYRPPNISHLPDEGGHITPFSSYSSALHVSVVEVDTDTGVVTLRRHVGIHDCGTMINPQAVEGQFHGGIVMGLGEALMEELVLDRAGALQSDGFKTYLLPRAVDVPPLEVDAQHIERILSKLGVRSRAQAVVPALRARSLNA
jgi:carbon-monoxide dehydrogenase large subunit